MINVYKVFKQYGTLNVLNGINFKIDKGEIVGLLGVNGAGKTTMMRILTSYLPATSGDVKISDYYVGRDDIDIKRCIGYLPENPPLYYSMRVKEYLKFAAEMKDVKKDQVSMKVELAIEKCLIGDVVNKQIGLLSKGFKQRVGLAQAIINDPKVLILDEPTSDLDPLQVNQVHRLLNDLKKDHTIILSTHILSEVERVAKRVLVLKDGGIALDDMVSNILEHYKTLEEMFFCIHQEKPLYAKD